MKFWIVAILAALTAAGMQAAESYTGFVTDTMCGATHNMGIAPDDKCVRECIRMDSGKWKYALLAGKSVFKLSDQQSPAQFAGKKVRITGQLYPKTGIIRVDRIELAR